MNCLRCGQIILPRNQPIGYAGPCCLCNDPVFPNGTAGGSAGGVDGAIYHRSEIESLKAAQGIFRSRIKDLEKELEDVKLQHSILSSKIKGLTGT